MTKILKDYEYFRTENGILYNGDVNEILPLLPIDSIDMVITSPPYNVMVNYDIYNDNISEEDYFKFTQDWISKLNNVVKIGGRLGINIPIMGNNEIIKKSDRLIFYLDKYVNLIQKDFCFRECITWIKSHGENNENSFCGNNTAWGSYLSPSNPFCRSFSEFIIIAHKQLPKIQHTGQTDLTKEEFLKWTKNIWFMPTDKNKEHPAVFHEELPKRLMKMYTYVGDTILEPFCGSGTVPLVCERLKRKWVAVELSRDYCELTRIRVEKYTRQIRMFE